jgi:hypothetical protein
MMSRFDPLGLRPDDPLEKWRDFHEKQEERFAEERRKEQEEERQQQEAAAAYEATLLRNAFEARIAALEQRTDDLEINSLEGARATRQAVEVLADEHVELSREQREELRELKNEVAKQGSTLTELREERLGSTTTGTQPSNWRT